MFRIMVKVNNKWKMGLNDYTQEQLALREEQLKNAKIKYKVVTDIFNTAKNSDWARGIA